MLLVLLRQVKAIQMNTNKRCFYKEANKNTWFGLKTTKYLTAITVVCVVIRSHMVALEFIELLN